MEDTQAVIEILKHAGQLALSYFRKVVPEWKRDLTYVTEADLAVQGYIQEALAKHFPGDGILAEENGLKAAPDAGSRIWVVDPIDGTAAFAAGLPIWGPGIALFEEGELVAGYFYAPAVGDLFYTTRSGKVLRNGHPTRLRQPVPFHRETSLLVASRLHRNYHIDPGFPGKLRNLGSSIAHLCYLATGCADAALMERVYVWDIAPGLAMLQHNGGILVYLDGTPVQISDLLQGQRAPQPMLAGHPKTIAALAPLIQYVNSPKDRETEQASLSLGSDSVRGYAPPRQTKSGA